jgi:hypothetical protein
VNEALRVGTQTTSNRIQKKTPVSDGEMATISSDLPVIFRHPPQTRPSDYGIQFCWSMATTPYLIQKMNKQPETDDTNSHKSARSKIQIHQKQTKTNSQR